MTTSGSASSWASDTAAAAPAAGPDCASPIGHRSGGVDGSRASARMHEQRSGRSRPPVAQSPFERFEPVERASDVGVQERELGALVFADDRRERGAEDNRCRRDTAQQGPGGATCSLAGLRNDQRKDTTTASTPCSARQAGARRPGPRRGRPASCTSPSRSTRSRTPMMHSRYDERGRRHEPAALRHGVAAGEAGRGPRSRRS